MDAERTPDWDPMHPSVLADQVRVYDELRRRCPVAYSDALGWSVLGHAETIRVLHDHVTFSNEVSRHLSVPNGFDPPRHTPYRRLIEPYFAEDRVAPLAPAIRSIAADLPDGEVEVMESLGHPFALGVQCRFMGWPDHLHDPLRAWIERSQAATRAQDRDELAEVATAFDGTIREQLDARRAAGDDAPDDPTTQLLRETIEGRPLTDEELVSIIRNWTVGELGTIAASIGVIVAHLAREPDLQTALRDDPKGLRPAIDEMLRLDGPLVANRRRATREVELGGRRIGAGERITILWPSANRDERVFGDQAFDPQGHASANLLYGAGIHACPGAPLARLELEIVVQELLAGTAQLTATSTPPVRAHYPAGGYATLPVQVARARTAG